MVKQFYTILGHICVVLAVIGLLLPLIPGFPFLFLAAFAYSRGSETFYNRLKANPMVTSLMEKSPKLNLPSERKIIAAVITMTVMGLIVFLETFNPVLVGVAVTLCLALFMCY